MTYIFKVVHKKRNTVKSSEYNIWKKKTSIFSHLQFSKLTNSFEKLRLHQMKQNKVRRKDSPHKEEMPFEMSNLNQKLEVRSISGWLHVCQRLLGLVGCVVLAAQWPAQLCYHIQAAYKSTSHCMHFLSVPSLQALSELKHHFDLYIFYIYISAFWDSLKGKRFRHCSCSCWLKLEDTPGVCIQYIF